MKPKLVHGTRYYDDRERQAEPMGRLRMKETESDLVLVREQFVCRRWMP